MIQKWLKLAVEKNASDIFIGTGRYISFKIDGTIYPQGETTVSPDEAELIINSVYAMAKRDMNVFFANKDDDFSISLSGLARFRVNTYFQRGTMAATIRVVLFDIPDYKKLHIPDSVMRITSEKNGLVFVTGPAGSGKTTTLACVIDAINKTRNGHIITIEDPIEFLHRDKKCLISQREIATDAKTYLSALHACLRQAPDIILLGEVRDYETIKAVMTAAETGHLVISTLHTVGAVNTIDRIIDVFPPNQQQQIRIQLSMLLRTVVSQRLLPDTSGGLVPAFEIMYINSAIRNLIRESKVHQVDGIIQTSSRDGMVSMDSYILDLYRNNKITAKVALEYAVNTEQMERRINI